MQFWVDYITDTHKSNFWKERRLSDVAQTLRACGTCGDGMRVSGQREISGKAD
jgi:hypothetical protein